MEVRVDGRVDLFSILFHLAGVKGYEAHDTPYRFAVESWFGAYGEHPAIEACRQLRAQAGISYNAPVGLAVFLEPKTLYPKIDLKTATELDERWQKVDVAQFLDVVRDFVASTDAEGFFKTQRAYFRKVERAMAAALKDARIDEWFVQTLGRPAKATFHVVPGLLTGRMNYGATARDAKGRLKIHQIVCLENVDYEGVPQPTRKTAELVAHELAHAYVNPIVDSNAAVLVPAAQPLFDSKRQEMSRQNYPSPKIMVTESLVRAIATLFARERLGDTSEQSLAEQDERLGFTWMRDLTRWISRQPKLDLARMVQPLTGFFAAQVPA